MEKDDKAKKMSQPRNSTDTQALLQSMLQRLKLQPGRDGQPYMHTPETITAASTWRQDGDGGGSNLQKAPNSPVNGFEFGINGTPSKVFGISAADSNFGFRGGEIQQPGLVCAVDRGVISFPTQKSNIDGDTGEDRVLEKNAQPGITTVGTGQLFPARSLKDADITSSERTEGKRVSLGSSAMTKHTPTNKDAIASMGQNQDHNQVFKPKSYMWSLKPTNTNTDAGSQEDKLFHVGNGEFGALAQSKDTQILQTDQNTTNSSRRKLQPSENKTRRWTQKIKERWRDRPGSFGKKGKEEERREEQKSERRTELSIQTQQLTAKTLIGTSNKEEEKALSSLDTSDPSKTPMPDTEDATNEEHTRSTSDFDFGLGSFSLLEEIVTGQEWAKFLNPNQANQRPSEELKIPPNSHDSSQSSLTLNHQGSVSNQWSFRGIEASPASDFSMAQISPYASLPASMDVTEGKQLQMVHREADHPEPMEHGHGQSDMRYGDSGLGQQLRPATFAQPADNLNKSALKSRGYLNRKRQHQAVERRDETLQTEKRNDVKEADREGSILSLSPTSSHVMEETGESQHDHIMPLYELNSPAPPLSPSSVTPFARAPKGVLKHSMSQDSESSMEIVTKRRRVEENRRVRFSTEVVAIDPPELDLNATDSEDDSGAEEDSVTEQESEVAQTEEEAPARRPALPAWILALKRRNTGRKHK